MDERTCRRCGGRFTVRAALGRKRFLCYGCSPQAAPRPPRSSRCEMCGLKFKYSGGQQHYCRIECRRQAERNAAADIRRPPIGHRPRCIICGGPVISRLPQAVTCSKRCKITRDARRRRSKDYRDPAGTESCALCDEPFSLPGVGSGKYCSGDCERRVIAAKRYGSKPRPRTRSFNCENCGISCVPGLGGVDCKASRFCSFECKRSWHRDLRRTGDQFVGGVSRQDIFDRDGWVCQLCGKAVPRSVSFPDPKSPTIDHVVPLSKGGAHEPSNVQLAHYACNSAKGNRVFGEGEQLRLVA